MGTSTDAKIDTGAMPAAAVTCAFPIFFATTEGQTRRIAERLAEELCQDHLESRAFAMAGRDAAALDWTRVRGAIVGASLHAGKHQKVADAFVRAHVAQLNHMPSAFFSVSLSAASKNRDEVNTAAHLARAFPALSILVGCEPHVAPVMRAGGAGSVNGLANVAPRLMRRVIDRPADVSHGDEAAMLGLLALLSVRPNMPFVSVYKTVLAEQTGDDAWLNVCAPLDPLDNTEARAVREGYRALGIDAATL